MNKVTCRAQVNRLVRCLDPRLPNDNVSTFTLKLYQTGAVTSRVARNFRRCVYFIVIFDTAGYWRQLSIFLFHLFSGINCTKMQDFNPLKSNSNCYYTMP